MLQRIRQLLGARQAKTEQIAVQPKIHRRHFNKDQFIVIGLGRFGTSLARSLIKQGHEVLAIDSNFARVQTLSTDLPHVLQLDATSREALIEIGAEHFDTGIVCIGENFESNLLATVQLRKLGVRRVISKARTRTQSEILVQVGADEVILPEHEAGVRLARRLSAIEFIDYLDLGSGMVLVELVTPRHLHGKTLLEADLRRHYNLTILAIRREKEVLLIPSAQTSIQDGDELLVAGKMADAERLAAK